MTNVLNVYFAYFQLGYLKKVTNARGSIKMFSDEKENFFKLFDEMLNTLKKWEEEEDEDFDDGEEEQQTQHQQDEGEAFLLEFYSLF